VALAVTPHTIVSKNLDAAATIYRSAQLDKARMFAVADHVASQFSAGLLPLGKGSGGKIHAYLKAREAAPDATARARIYGHVLGGDTRGKMQVNRDFAPLLARFVDAVSAFERGAKTGKGGAKSVDPKTVRQRARDLALNLSNRTYGAPVDVAPALQVLGERAQAVLDDAAVQDAFAVSGADALVDRVARDQLQVTVDAAAQRGRADAGAQVIRSLRGIATASPSKGGKGAEDAASTMARVGASVRTLDRTITAKHKPRAASKQHHKVLALCLDDDGGLSRCATKSAE